MEFHYISLLLGLVLVALGLAGWHLNTGAGAWLQAFPRNRKWAVVLAALNTAWAAWWVYQMPLGRFAWIQPWLGLLALAAWWLTIRFMDELLAPRMLGGFLLLLAVPILNAARWHPSPWRLIVPVLVYIWVLWGMWLMLSPYRFRHSFEWVYATPQRARSLYGGLLAIGMLVSALSLLVFRA